MSGFLKRIAAFIVFRNIFIAIATSCLVAETRFLGGGDWFSIDALIVFTFFATFLVYNFHSFSNDPKEEFSFPQLFKNFMNPEISLEQRICVAIGTIGTAIAFPFLERKAIVFLLPVALITMAYSLPVFRFEDRLRGLRDIIYVKILTVALVWAVATTWLPYINDNGTNFFEYILLFIERFLFIYAITIPFEIRDRNREAAIGNRTIPLVFGVARSKRLGYVLLALFCIVVLIREHIYSHSVQEGMKHFAALFISAATAALLIFKTNDSQNRWYYKGLIDGTMIQQFLLLILVEFLC